MNWLVEVVESQDFIISNLDFLGELSSELFFFSDLLLKRPKHLVILFASLISFTDFLSPLVLVSEDSFLHLKSGGKS